ncbi:hypothetical protein Leryth_026551 [Lithospermum erythrorhizon]|uniref:Uncharacterized protein n=1 Tax=Lithospermum erythrorhizon TaxID=34254 RepID=A0AAV3RJT8_LITER|nr:hypothetical protein Leryth_026551 [Lithospermum erythrorhizon]
MATAMSDMINGGNNIMSSRVVYSRPIPRRGQVKVAIMSGLAHALSSIFSNAKRNHL